MATLYDAAGAVVATGFTALRDSRLVQRRTDVVHDPLLGGLPYVVSKAPGGLAGNLELLCPSAAMADAVYAAHRDGAHLRLDDWTQQNLVTDPRATTAPPWAAFGGSTAVESMVTGAVDGPVLPDGTLVATYARYTLNAVGTGNAQYGYSQGVGNPLPMPILADASVAIAIYVRSSVAVPSISVRKDAYLAGVAAGGAQVVPSSSLAANTWERRAGVIINNANFDEIRVTAQFPAGSRSVGQIIDVVCALVTPDATEVPDHFDGATPDTASLVNEWAGAANASVSQQYGRPALNLTYTPVGGVGLPIRESTNYWRVSVPSVQEVAP